MATPKGKDSNRKVKRKIPKRAKFKAKRQRVNKKQTRSKVAKPKKKKKKPGRKRRPNDVLQPIVDDITIQKLNELADHSDDSAASTVLLSDDYEQIILPDAKCLLNGEEEDGEKEKLYRFLTQLITDTIVLDESMILLLLEVIEELNLTRFKQLAPERAVSFIRRLLLLSLNLSGPEAAACLTVVRRFWQEHSVAAEWLLSQNDNYPSGFTLDRQGLSTDEPNSQIICHLLHHQHACPYVRYLAFALLAHFSVPQTKNRLRLVNRALARKAIELNLIPKLCQQLLDSENPRHACKLLHITSVDLGGIFSQLPATTQHRFV